MSSIKSASCVVLLPGAAQASQTISPGSGSSASAGSADTSSWPCNQPWKYGHVVPGAPRQDEQAVVPVDGVVGDVCIRKRRPDPLDGGFDRVTLIADGSGRSHASMNASKSSMMGRRGRVVPLSGVRWRSVCGFRTASAHGFHRRRTISSWKQTVSPDGTLTLDTPPTVSTVSAGSDSSAIAALTICRRYDMEYYASAHCEGLPEVAVYGTETQRFARRSVSTPTRSVICSSSRATFPSCRRRRLKSLTAFRWFEANDAMPVFLSGRPTEKDPVRGRPRASRRASQQFQYTLEVLINRLKWRDYRADRRASSVTANRVDECRTHRRSRPAVPRPRSGASPAADSDQPTGRFDIDTEARSSRPKRRSRQCTARTATPGRP